MYRGSGFGTLGVGVRGWGLGVRGQGLFFRDVAFQFLFSVALGLSLACPWLLSGSLRVRVLRKASFYGLSI